jgi:WD40 repeat protein
VIKKCGLIVAGTTSNGFVIWDFNDEDNISREAIVLKLPYGTRNITTKMLQSNSIMLSGRKNYAIAGVRKNLYVWSMTNHKLVKILDAHFGRIIQLEALTIGNWNSIVTSSIDRTVKVWNINNIFEQVHVIDRHELQVDSIRFVRVCDANSIRRVCDANSIRRVCDTNSIRRVCDANSIRRVCDVNSTGRVCDTNSIEVCDANTGRVCDFCFFSLSDDLSLAVTVTRNCVGVWNLRIGKLMSKLADSPLGAIVTHAIITPDGKYIISAESGNFLIWLRLTQQVIYKEEQPGIRQLTLMDEGTKVLSISKPSNPPGTDLVRTVATACVREVPSK